MPLCIRRTYIRDRTRNTHTYITEYSAAIEMEKCQKSFDNLRELLTKYPTLWYPDPNKDNTLFIDASKFGYAGILTQEYEDNSVIKRHPVCYISCLFRGSQLNWTALTKESTCQSDR